MRHPAPFGTFFGLALVALCALATPVRATLVGDEVAATLFTIAAGGFDPPPTAIVGAGTEFSATYNGGLEGITLDIDADSFTFTFFNNFPGDEVDPDGSFNLGLLGFEITDLDFSPAAIVTGVTQTSSTFPTGTFNQVTVGPDSVHFDVPPGLIIPGKGTIWTATWQIETAVPEPQVGVLLGTGLAAMGWSRRRR